jgi:hypothetical protein
MSAYKNRRLIASTTNTGAKYVYVIHLCDFLMYIVYLVFTGDVWCDIINKKAKGAGYE